MTNHVHLLLTPTCCAGAGLLMKGLGQRYVQYVNRTCQRTGTLWEGRFRSCLVQQDNYVLACYRYIEMNPVRFGSTRQLCFSLLSIYRNEPGQSGYGCSSGRLPLDQL
ncbi:transposase [Pseudomonas sp. Leaf15]|uniref:transposase n=1 Tax=Pseudomonas sp. Leaf15 TaxID=1735680 RepID=UPI001F3BA527|nr:transposase [Pseudomonas sp. Leaf15]